MPIRSDVISRSNFLKLYKHTWALITALPLPTPNLDVPAATPTKHTVWVVSGSSTVGVAILDGPGDFQMLKNPRGTAKNGGPRSDLLVEFSDVAGNKPTYTVGVVVEENAIEVGRFVAEIAPIGGGLDDFVAIIKIDTPLPPVPLAPNKIIYFLEFAHDGGLTRNLIFSPAKYYEAKISSTGFED